MNIKGPEASVSGALSIVLHVSRFAGLAPLRFVKQRGGWRVSLSPWLSIYGWVLVTVVNLIILVTVIMDLCVDPTRSILMKTLTQRVVWILDALIIMTIAFLGAAEAPKQMQSMICCLNILQKVNNDLNICPWPKRKEIKKVVLILFWSLLTIALTLTDHMLLSSIIIEQHGSTILCIMYLFYYMCYWIMQLRIFQFILITLHICHSFKAINEQLKNLSQAVSYFSLETVDLVIQIVWCVFHFTGLVMMIEPCHLTLEEIRGTREQISHLMRHTSSLNEPLAIELDLFFKQLVLNRVSYSPLNVTKLTRRLVVTIIGSVTTYLAIIIQL